VQLGLVGEPIPGLAAGDLSAILFISFYISLQLRCLHVVESQHLDSFD
jgi:hypothetical protein